MSIPASETPPTVEHPQSPAPASLAERAYTEIEERIVTLRIPPGQPVSDVGLARDLGISRTPVREALLRLAEDSLVEIHPRRGIFVTQIDLLDHLDLLETRRALDAVLASMAARRATDGQRARLAECSRAMRQAAAEGRTDAFMRLDREFDLIVYEASRNRSAVRAAGPLHTHCRRFWYFHQGELDLGQSARHHAAIMDAIVAAAPEAAVAASHALIDYLQRLSRSVMDG